jgi:hypothetical protein
MHRRPRHLAAQARRLTPDGNRAGGCVKLHENKIDTSWPRSSGDLRRKESTSFLKKRSKNFTNCVQQAVQTGVLGGGRNIQKFFGSFSEKNCLLLFFTQARVPANKLSSISLAAAASAT